MWLKQAHVARRGGDEAPNVDFRAGKVAAFRYFMRYELPKAEVLLRPVESLDAICLKMRAEGFAGA